MAKIVFNEQKEEECSRAELFDAAESHLSLLLKNGQICSEYILGWVKEELTAFVYLARPDAIEEQSHSKWGKDSLKRLFENFGVKPHWHVLDDDIPDDFVSLQSVEELILTTNMLASSSPVRSLVDGAAIPLYLLPLTDNDKEAVYFWQGSYQSHDRVWMGSADLETVAYKQLAELDSGLSKRGRELCTQIEEATRIPTYYYLHRYFGRKEGEEERLCPGCGGNWRVKDKPNNDSSFWNFGFKCERCRLVSHLACSTEDERRARIGEYKTGKIAG